MNGFREAPVAEGLLPSSPGSGGRWQRTIRGDGSLVYRDARTGCTLQNVSYPGPAACTQFSDRWLLFAPDLILLAALRGGSRGSDPPLAAAEEAAAEWSPPPEAEPPISSIDYEWCYSLR